LAGFVATEDRGRSIAVFNYLVPADTFLKVPDGNEARTFFNAIRTLSLHGITSVQAQPSSFSAIPECQIFVMWLILSPVNCIT
jgi:hypothetical protein